jgi:hypothetical protein
VSKLSQLLSSFTPEELERLKTRFWEKVDKRGPDDCWLWTAGLRGSGRYGGFKTAIGPVLSHVLAWELERGRVEDGLFVCHSCDARYSPGDATYRRCCNHNHLWLGTAAQNATDAKNKGRCASGDRNGQRLHPERTARGERNGLSKLTEPLVILARELKASGVRNPEIAEIIGISPSHLCRVLSGECWGHV